MVNVKLTNFKEEMKKQIEENKMNTYIIGVIFEDYGDELDNYEIDAENEEEAVEKARQKVLESFKFLILREEKKE